MVSVTVSLITQHGERDHLVNYFRSLARLDPDEICIVDTTRTDKAEEIKDFHRWLRAEAEKHHLPLLLKYRRWDGNYRDTRNLCLSMGTGDWTLILDSDEMITLEVAADLRIFLGGLPGHALAVRPRMLNLFDEHHCLRRDYWQRRERRSVGIHPRIVRTGVARYKGPTRHEILIYPGRTSISLRSPDHPLVDWHGYYLLHLWLYKDAPMRRRWGVWLPRHTIPTVTVDEAWQLFQKLWLRNRGGLPLAPIPPGVSWVPIVWTVNIRKWCVLPEGNRFMYRRIFDHPGR